MAPKIQICFPKILHDIPQAVLRLIVSVQRCSFTHMIQLRGLALKLISILAF